MEGPRANIADAGAKESPTKFVARLPGEGHREYLVGVDLALRDAPLDSKSQDVGLSRSRSRANEQTAGRRRDGLTLFGRQPHEHVVGEGRLICHSAHDATGTA